MTTKSDKTLLALAKINDAANDLRNDETPEAWRALHDQVRAVFGSGSVGIDYSPTNPERRGYDGEERWCDFWVAFSETEVAARVRLEMESGEVSIAHGSDSRGDLANCLLSEALWAVEAGEADDDLKAHLLAIEAI
jgi:hypothetical protein